MLYSLPTADTMRAVPVLVLYAIFTMSIAFAQVQTENYGTIDNSLEPRPSVRLDPYIRKALLKALTDLEENDNVTNTETTDVHPTAETEFLRTGEDISTVDSTSRDGIQIHSYVVNGQSAFSNSTDATPTEIDSSISILGTTVGNVENQVAATLPTQNTYPEIFESKETTNLSYLRTKQSPKIDGNKKDTTIKPPTTTTTTTTTPKPTHDNDGKNIEEVDKKDVQVFQAPLVAAFTVHQDAHGLPKKVVPIYQQTNVQDALKSQPTSNVPTGVLPPQILSQNFPSEHRTLNKPQNSFISQQLLLQKQLEEKQRILEEQLQLLQLQQRQQEELLRKQHFIFQQKEAQRQQQLFEQEQLKRQQFLIEQQNVQTNQVLNNFQGPKSVQPNRFLNPIAVQQNPNPQVSIQPSVHLEQVNVLANQQQLPNREAVDFLIHLRSQRPEQFPLQENHLPQGISSFLQPNPSQSPFHLGPNFNHLRLPEEQNRQKQSNRVFRQESGVGNFGLNNPEYNRFNNFSPIYTNRFFPLNRQNQFNADAQLKQLLVQTGLNGKAHEDLNIVTKVLSLNHGIPVNNNVSNRLPFDSRRHVRTFL